MATRPGSGHTLPRLCPPLTLEQAVGLAEALLHDTVQNVQRANCGEIVLACTPTEEEVWFAERFPGRARIPQRGADLGTQLISVLDEAWKRRYQPCVVIGTDSPDLPAEFLTAAFDALKPGPSCADVVLSPSQNGGYALIGLRWKEPRLFTDIAWGTSQEYSQLQERAASLALRVHLLPEWPEVDTPEDLEALRLRLHDAASEICPATRLVLAAGISEIRSE